MCLFGRTRDAVVLGTCDVVVDVGKMYDHSSKRYDYQQRYTNSVSTALVITAAAAAVVVVVVIKVV